MGLWRLKHLAFFQRPRRFVAGLGGGRRAGPEQEAAGHGWELSTASVCWWKNSRSGRGVYKEVRCFGELLKYFEELHLEKKPSSRS